MTTVHCVHEAHALLGEAPFWDTHEQVLTWVDIYGRRIHRLYPQTGSIESWLMPDRVAAAVPRAQGGFLVALSRTLALFDPVSGQIQTIFTLDGADTGTRFNDSRTDSLGRLWIGTMNETDDAPSGTLFRFDAQHVCTAMESGLRISNSINFSPDDRLFYLADTPERIIRAYDFDLAAGTIADRRDLLTVHEGDAMPDGSAVDVEGCIWNAQWEGSRVVRYAPDGRVLRIVELPVSHPTSCVFGGPDLTTLYVTSSCMELTGAQLRAQPLAGSLFAFDAGVAGRGCTRFAG
jgi:sugar lactone lactonase YvrE